MKGNEIFEAVVVRCLEFKINVITFAPLLHSAVLCMGQTPLATDHNIYCKYFEREAVRLGMCDKSRQPAFASVIEIYNEPCSFLKSISFYLPKGSEIQNAHIEAYDNLLKIVPELWELIPQAGGREMTTITAYLMGDIIESVRQLHANHN